MPLFKGKIMTRCNVAHSIVVETRVRSQASADGRDAVWLYARERNHGCHVPCVTTD